MLSNVARVRARKAAGGHDVPEDKIRARYHRALALLHRLIYICDKILIYDNSGDVPVLIFSKVHSYTESFPNKFWTQPALSNLFGL